MTWAKLLPHHTALITASRIAPAVATERGYRSVTIKADLARLGFGRSQQLVPGLLLPIWTVNGTLDLYQLRPDDPRVHKGKRLKYETPAQARMVLDVPPRVRTWLADPHVPLFVTEGVRKADSAASQGLCCVDVLGVWNWRGTNADGGRVALPDWESVHIESRETFFAFDSDVMTNPAVHQALSRFGAFLNNKGAKVRYCYLPAGSSGAKVGLDDFFAADGTVDDLVKLARTDLLLPEQAVPSSIYLIQEGRLVYRTRGPDEDVTVPLCNFTAEIVEEVIADDGHSERSELIIRGTLASGQPLPSARVLATRFQSLDWVIPHWGTTAILEAGFGTRDRLRAAIQHLSPNVKRRRVYTHSGWREIEGTWFYLHAGGAIGPVGSVFYDQIELQGSHDRLCLPEPPIGDERTAAIREALDMQNVASDRIMIPLLGAVFAAPLCEISPVDASIFLTGESGALKSELAALAQRFFGSAFDRMTPPGSFLATANALEKIVFDYKDAICVIDDFAPTGSSFDVQTYHKIADRLFCGVGNRAGRGRMTATGELRMEYVPRGLVVATGEDVPRGPSCRARLVVLEVERECFGRPGDVDSRKLAQFQVEPGRSIPARAMSAYLTWLADKLPAFHETLPADHRKFRSLLASAHPRTPDALAHLAIGWATWLRFAFDVGALTEVECEAGWIRATHVLSEVAATQADDQTAE